MTFTKERLQQVVHAAGLEPCDHEEVFDSITVGEIVMMARQLLASMEQEPVGEVVLGDYDDRGDYPDAKVACIAAQGRADWNNFGNGTKLYAAPLLPQPAVPDEIDVNDPALDTHRKWMAEGWNRCRAAMLRAGNHTEQRLDMVEHSGDANKMVAGNSPVIPNGYVLVPIVPTEDMIINGFESEPDEFFSKSEDWDAYQEMSGCEQAAHRAELCWAAMIKAAPKQENI